MWIAISVLGGLIILQWIVLSFVTKNIQGLLDLAKGSVDSDSEIIGLFNTHMECQHGIKMDKFKVHLN